MVESGPSFATVRHGHPESAIAKTPNDLRGRERLGEADDDVWCA
jgi:hypothetical protein